MVKTLSKHLVVFAKIFIGFYYHRIAIRGAPISKKPTLFIASHRNGAVDGFVLLNSIGNIPSLVSIQLLRNKVLRLFFDGIPVVREKDIVRYGIKRSDIASPLLATVAQISQGGSIILYPEGTSEWQSAPLSYDRGMALIIKKLLNAKVDFQVQPIGMFYTRPDAMRSHVSIILGEPFKPVPQDVKSLYKQLSGALNAVSVNCTSVTGFNRVQSYAWQQYKQGESFGAKFLACQHASQYHVNPIEQSSSSNDASLNMEKSHFQLFVRFRKVLAHALLFMGLPLIYVCVRITERFSDGRNNKTFFRLIGAIVGALLTGALCCGLCLAVFLKLISVPFLIQFFLLSVVCTVIGWLIYPEPEPLPLFLQ